MPSVRQRRVQWLSAIAVGLWAWQGVLHGWYALAGGDSRLWLPHGVAWLHDGVLLALVGALAAPFGRWAWLMLAALGAALSVYPQMLGSYLATQTNIFGADLATPGVFLTQYLGVALLWPAAGAVLSVVWTVRQPLILRSRPWFKVGAALVLVGAALTLPRSPHPVVGSLWREAADRLTGSVRVVPSLRMGLPIGPATATNAEVIKLGPIQFRHVFLIVLEGVPAADFEREFVRRPNGFYAQVQSQARYFGHYYSTNLDSYTSLIAMLTGQQVPYRAYTQPSDYDAVNLAPNLTRTLRANGFHSAFVSTYAYQPFVPTRGDWDQVLDGSDLATGPPWLSLGSNRMEQATEDKAALALLLDNTLKHERNFVLHEMVYGHSPEWQAKTGQTPCDYYDSYLTDLRNGLASRGTLDDSLIIVVSDHGDRSKAADATNYRVPLLVVGRGIAPAEDVTLYAHLDLPQMTQTWLQGLPLPAGRPWVNLVGSTERWVYGRITTDGQHVLIDNARGALLSQFGKLNPAVFQAEFQTGLDAFAQQFGAYAAR
ncbi:MAG: sulfatase-like hydrolase/transferase [Rhodoferax sp.]|uniref:sulfatase-like hydrolase/transferase n=1 Tax=Rhodoferax sp. TaxID=50421 RepID=UPI001B5731EE|nr:sulfatase-like hydrolase/transferase [Rhodoferax sp.]MBP9907297.1 sulfatase-like hydrolase/transferase [Rhodoferax sp.]